MRINTNIMALNAQNKLVANQGKVENSIQKLSSGLRINGAADDAAGLAISEKMRAQIRGLNQAESNAQDGISLLQTAEGALQQTTDILQRMRELVIKAQNSGVLTEEDKTSISNELSTLRDEIDRIGNSTTFNGKKLLNGDFGSKAEGFSVDGYRLNASAAEYGTSYGITATEGKAELKLNGTLVGTATWDTSNTSFTGTINFEGSGISIDVTKEVDAANIHTSLNNKSFTTKAVSGRGEFKVGANIFKDDTMVAGIEDMTSKGLSKKGDASFTIEIGDRTKSDTTLSNIDYAINRVSAQRSRIGAIQNRMEYAISNLSTSAENLTAAESRIRDVDMAEEMVNYTKSSILNQSAMAMLAQANQQPQSILSLLS